MVRGPELLSGTVGESSSKVRDLFVQAENDWKLYGTLSPLHVVVIDEIDTLCPHRGSAQGLDGGASDQVVGQFLSIIDGLKTMNNMLVIGTTNRVDLLDPALIRPGRLQHLFKVGVPDIVGREAIWRIHTKALVANNIIEADYIPKLAAQTDGFTGAMIAGTVSDSILEARRSALPTTNSLSLKTNALKMSEALTNGQFKVPIDMFLSVINKYKSTE